MGNNFLIYANYRKKIPTYGKFVRHDKWKIMRNWQDILPLK